MLHQSLQQKMLQKLSPQQIQLMKLLQIPTISLEQRIKEEIEENPALEEGTEEEEGDDIDKNDDEFDDAEGLDSNDDRLEGSKDDEFNIADYIGDDDDIPGYKTQINNSSPDDEHRDIPFASGISFNEIMLSQLGLGNVDERQYKIAEIIIGNIDDAGYLERELSAIVNDLMFTYNINATEVELESILSIIQSFDPPGVGARSLRECLLIQLKRKDNTKPSVQIGITILEKHFDEFTKKHFDKISTKLNISDEALKEAINEILKLNPKPANSLMDNKKGEQYITPDFFIYNNNGTLELTLNARNAPELRLSRTYTQMLQEYGYSKDKKAKEAVQFVRQKIDSAKWFISAISQRQNTLLITMDAIMNYQYEFFLDGDETKLKPMILKDIAEIINMDISTISRVVNSKYVQTPFGTFLLKSFFSESLSTDSGEEVSTKEVKKILQDCIGAEDKHKPLTDDKLMEILNDKGYNIARRTVAKYREQLNIPVARMRKEM